MKELEHAGYYDLASIFTITQNSLQKTLGFLTFWNEVSLAHQHKSLLSN
jgi:hypothetical protein